MLLNDVPPLKTIYEASSISKITVNVCTTHQFFSTSLSKALLTAIHFLLTQIWGNA